MIRHLKIKERISLMTLQKAILFTAMLGILYPALAQFEFDRLDDDPLYGYDLFDFWSSPRFNRVEGAVAHSGIFVKPWMRSPIASRLELGYATKREKVNFSVGLEYRLLRRERLIFYAEYFDETMTNDHWIMGTLENSLACLFLREDFRNYYGKKGWRIFADKRFGESLIFRIEHSSARYEDMATFSNFSGTLFGGNKSFRPNPAIIPGLENLWKFSAFIDRRDNPYFPNTGWMLVANLQSTSGDFKTTGLFLSSKIYLSAFQYQRLIIEGLAGSRTGSLAQQYLIPIGGIGTCRAFSDFDHFGQNLLLARLHYVFGGQILKKTGIMDWPIMDSASLGLFFEIGDAWGQQESFDILFQAIDSFKPMADAGISFLLFDGFYRIDLSRQIISGDGDWRLTMRLFNKL